jgi:hypothetical protein
MSKCVLESIDTLFEGVDKLGFTLDVGLDDVLIGSFFRRKFVELALILSMDDVVFL